MDEAEARYQVAVSEFNSQEWKSMARDITEASIGGCIATSETGCLDGAIVAALGARGMGYLQRLLGCETISAKRNPTVKCEYRRLWLYHSKRALRFLHN